MHEVRPNDRCPCGSGKKHENCCQGKPGRLGALGSALQEGLDEGYAALADDDLEDACRIWWRSWERFERGFTKEVVTVADVELLFDRPAQHDVFAEWVEDFSSALLDVAPDDPSFVALGRRFSEAVLARFPDEPEAFSELLRADIATYDVWAGDFDRGEARLRQLIAERPGRAVGYVRLAEFYSERAEASGKKRAAGLERAYELLEQALAAEDARDFGVRSRLAEVCAQLGKDVPAAAGPDEPIDWKAALADVPTENWFEDVDLVDTDDLDEAIQNFIFVLEDYLCWEAVIRQEQDLLLTREQEAALDTLVSFEDEPSESILYINERARPHEPWYDTLRRLAEGLAVDSRFDPRRHAWECYTEGWPRLLQALDEGAAHLSLPPGAFAPEDVVPLALRHQLCLQHCLDALTMIDEEGGPDVLLARLREHRTTVTALELSPRDLVEGAELPEAERQRLAEMLRNALDLPSTDAPMELHL